MQLSANTQVKTIEGHVRARPRTRHAYRPPARLPRALTRLLPVACAVHGPLQGRGHQAPCAHGRIKPPNPRATRTLCLPPRLPRAENVLIMRDVACAGYVAGMNATFFARNQGEKTYSLETARQNIQDRLSFADDVGAKYASMLAFPATEQQLEANQGFDTVMSVTSRLLPWEVTGPSARDHSSFPGGQSVYEQYNQKLGLQGVHYGEVRPRAAHQTTRGSARLTAPPRVRRT